ncbi:unnamed protein product [Effrenium voratum]|uniref:Uncharacterized protein n=1 Tax=Effrenium voratum TaxID=2562239 RepID=A0AA36HKY8_9DINO|nr:unnamed protein product [Effrenium voratum]
MSGISRVLAASQDFTKKVLTKEAEAHAKMIIEIRKQVYAKVALKDEGMQNDFVRENHNMEEIAAAEASEQEDEELDQLQVDTATDCYIFEDNNMVLCVRDWRLAQCLAEGWLPLEPLLEEHGRPAEERLRSLEAELASESEEEV